MIISLTTIFVFTSVFSAQAQCEFPYNSGTRQFMDAISYTGTITKTRKDDGSVDYSIDPSKLELKQNENFVTRLQLSSTGQWFYKWNYSASPNHWRSMILGCDQSTVNIMYDAAVFPNGGKLEVDFFYLDSVVKVSAGFMGSVSTRILP